MNLRLAILILLFPFITFGQDKECECWRIYTGTFYSVLESGDTILYERTKERQTEYLQTKPRNKFKLNIIWLNECKYILRYSKDNPSLKQKFMKGDIISKIIETGEDYFVVESKAKGEKKLSLTIYSYPPGSEL